MLKVKVVILIKRIGKAAFVNHWKIHLSICDDYHTLGCSRLVFGVSSGNFDM